MQMRVFIVRLWFITADEWVFTEPLKAVKGFKGDTLEISCEVNDENAEVEWVKHGKVLKPSEKYELISDGTKRTLIIKEVVPVDGARYTCQLPKDKTAAGVDVQSKLILNLILLKGFFTINL